MFYASTTPRTSHSRHWSRSRRRSSSYHRSGNRTRSHTRRSEIETEYETREAYYDPPSYGQPVYYTSPACYTPVPDHAARERRSSYERTSRNEYAAEPEHRPSQTTYYYPPQHTSRSEYERDHSYYAKLQYSSERDAGYASSYTRTSPGVRFATSSTSSSDTISADVTFVNLGYHTSSREATAIMKVKLDKDRHGDFVSSLTDQIEAGIRAIARRNHSRRTVSAECSVYSIYMKYERKPAKNRELLTLDNDEAMKHLMRADRKGRLAGIEVLYKQESW